MPEMTPLEAAEIILNPYGHGTSERNKAECMAASYLRATAAGKYKQVVYARWKLVSEGARCNLVKCTHCGRSIAVTKNVPLDKWRAAKPYCDQCGALMGKDDGHE